MLDYEDRIVEHPNRFRIIKVPGTDDIFDLFAVPGIITKIGRALNKIFFDSIKNDLKYTVPQGGIIMWSGSTVPEGWFLCDGQNGTPDLRNRFIVGAGDSYNIGNTGGADSVTLTKEQIPSHYHSVNFTCGYTEGGSGNLVASSGSGASFRDGTETTGGGQAHENRPPYYALAFIMKA